MIHKFVANDNKGNVNTLEVTSKETLIHNLAAPSEDGDPVTKKYFDDNVPDSSSGLFVVKVSEGVLDKKYSKILAAAKTSVVVLMNASDDAVYSIDYLYQVYEDEGDFKVVFYSVDDDSTVTYIADSATGYPVAPEDNTVVI